MTRDDDASRPILFVERDETTAEIAQSALARVQRVVRTVRSVDDALRALSTERFGLAILDHRLEDGESWSILEAARALSPRVPVIVVTEAADGLAAAEAFARGASAYLVKSDTLWDRLPTIAERLARDAAVEHENAVLASVVRYSDDAILSESLAGEIMSWNPAAERMFGYAPGQIVGLHASVLFPPDRAEAAAAGIRLFADGLPRCGRLSVRRRKDESTFETSETVSPIRDAAGAVVGAAIVVRDITEQKSLEAQLRQAQKMEVVGLLAGGIAHDFNNLLTVITGYGEMLCDKLDENDPLRGDVMEIRRAGQRAGAITQQLLAFSRMQVATRHVVGLNDVIAKMGTLLRRLLGEDVELTTFLDAADDRVRVDPGQFEQVVVNLAVNARDAMPDGGRLTISTRNAESDAADAAPGRRVVVSVSDTGCGMSRETLSRVFEPFFTTKTVGKGTGLGLSTAHAIVTESGGRVSVRSDIGRGTTFDVRLPCVDAPVDAPTVGPDAPARVGGDETILLAEDDAAIRELVRTVLEKHGYAVLEARNGRKALIVCDAHAGEIDLLITDVVMDSMGGPALAAAVEARRPRVRVLYMSGYADDAVFREGRLPPGTGCLAKPFTTDQLLRRVRAILDAKRS